MARYHQGDFSDAPAMIMSPMENPQLPPYEITSLPFSNDTEPKDTSFPQYHANDTKPSIGAESITPSSTNRSRKRSRDETDFSLYNGGSYFASQQVHTPATIPEEPINGEGMVLSNPSIGMSISAGSQIRTGYEEKTETESKPEFAKEIRPTLPSPRKSVRLDPDAPAPRLDDIAAAVAPESPPKSSSSQPTIDDFTYALGIGWTRMASEDPDIQAAARGWARYLENHYPRNVHGAEILLKSKGHNAYLVGCQEGFYLFSEDLLEGRLVGRNWDSCLNNLRTHPIAFEDENILRAEETPGPDHAGFMNGVRDGSSIGGNILANGGDAGVNDIWI